MNNHIKTLIILAFVVLSTKAITQENCSTKVIQDEDGNVTSVTMNDYVYSLYIHKKMMIRLEYLDNTNSLVLNFFTQKPIFGQLRFNGDVCKGDTLFLEFSDKSKMMLMASDTTKGEVFVHPLTLDEISVKLVDVKYSISDFQVEELSNKTLISMVISGHHPKSNNRIKRSEAIVQSFANSWVEMSKCFLIALNSIQLAPKNIESK